MVPYLKGIHHTLESWRNNRNKDSWKHSDKEWAMMCELMGEEYPKHEGGVPNEVKGVKGVEISQVIYGFGDTSGGGIGSSFEIAAGVHYRLVVWSREMDDSSSNFRELKNLADVLEDK
eukprot:6219797-Ditylum_brightwellii.AAC.1